MAELDDLRRILVPVDFAPALPDQPPSQRTVRVGEHALEFSAASLRAVDIAIELARKLGAELRLVHATPALDTTTMYTGPAGLRLPAAVVSELHDRARETSIAALQSLTSDRCVGMQVGLVARPGVPLQVILEEAANFGADLVVLAASGRSKVARFFLGSTADRVIRQAHCPVLVVPAGGD